MISRIKSFLKFLMPRYQKLALDYKVEMKPRYGHGKKAHGLLLEIIEKNRVDYESLIAEALTHQRALQAIRPAKGKADDGQPSWRNGFFPGLDTVALYTMIARHKPAKYIEIGSGNSTRIAKKSIVENKLATRITSIDPFPRADVSRLADEIIRQPLEKLEDYRFITEGLEKGDILFVDNSHRCLPNSDATVCFLELFPYLKKGVIVHVHDVYLPYDYPQFMCDRAYSEQYVLAAFILANPEKYRTIFPAFFVSEDAALSKKLEPIWDHPNSKDAERHGGSFWLEIG